jgi:hypothetical protein
MTIDSVLSLVEVTTTKRSRPINKTEASLTASSGRGSKTPNREFFLSTLSIDSEAAYRQQFSDLFVAIERKKREKKMMG